VTGDLARRKLIPGLLHLDQAGLMPDCRIIGTALDELDDGAFRGHVRTALAEFARVPVEEAAWRAFSDRLTYVCSRADRLANGVAIAEQALGSDARRLHYLAVPPA